MRWQDGEKKFEQQLAKPAKGDGYATAFGGKKYSYLRVLCVLLFKLNLAASWELFIFSRKPTPLQFVQRTFRRRVHAPDDVGVDLMCSCA